MASELFKGDIAFKEEYEGKQTHPEDVGRFEPLQPSGKVFFITKRATAATFGLLDSLVPYFTHQSSPLNVLFFVFGSVGIYSLCLIPYTEGKFIPRRKNADSWMWTSAIFMGGQAVLMSIAIGLYQVPTAANVFYACRGLWAVILVAWLGKKMQIDESDSSPSTIT